MAEPGVIRAGRAAVEAGLDESALVKGLRGIEVKIRAAGTRVQSLGHPVRVNRMPTGDENSDRLLRGGGAADRAPCGNRIQVCQATVMGSRRQRPQALGPRSGTSRRCGR